MKRLSRTVNDLLVAIVLAERRIDPYVRGPFDALFQKPLTRAVQALINRRRPDEHLAIAEERVAPDEAEITGAIIKEMSRFTRRTYQGRVAERAGNTKTYGVVKGTFTVRADLPEDLRVGVFREPGRTSQPGYDSPVPGRSRHPIWTTTACSVSGSSSWESRARS